MGDEESRKVAIRLVVQNNINPNLKITNCKITIIAIFIPTQCHYPYSFIPHLRGQKHSRTTRARGLTSYCSLFFPLRELPSSPFRCGRSRSIRCFATQNIPPSPTWGRQRYARYRYILHRLRSFGRTSAPSRMGRARARLNGDEASARSDKTRSNATDESSTTMFWMIRRKGYSLRHLLHQI